MNKFVLVDTCYWFGLLSESDQHHESALEISELIEDYIIVVPYPTMYEILNTKFVKKKEQLIEFEQIMKSDRVQFIYDEDYRDKAIQMTYSIYRKNIPQVALVDSVIREIIRDINLNIDYLITFNIKDFKDVCDIRGIQIYSGKV